MTVVATAEALKVERSTLNNWLKRSVPPKSKRAQADLARLLGTAIFDDQPVQFTTEPDRLKKGVNINLVGERGVSENHPYGLTDDTPSRPMPTRHDCESYLRRVLDAAQDEGSPENIPAIMHRLKKTFPMDEFVP